MKQEHLKEIEQLIYDKRTIGAFVITIKKDGHGGAFIHCEDPSLLISAMISMALNEPQFKQIFNIVVDGLGLYEREHNGQEN